MTQIQVTYSSEDMERAIKGMLELTDIMQKIKLENERLVKNNQDLRTAIEDIIETPSESGFISAEEILDDVLSQLEKLI